MPHFHPLARLEKLYKVLLNQGTMSFAIPKPLKEK
jgi:hypothetical protein